MSPATTPRKREPSTRPTLQQVAALSGYAISTVSAVLNGKDHCWASEETRSKVLAAAASLGYRPNLAARWLRGATTQTLGLVTVSLNVEVTALKVQAFESAARDAGYTTMITYNPNEPISEDKLLVKLRDRTVDGIAIAPTEHGPHHELRRLVEQGFPVVTWDGAGRLGFDCDDVSTDYFEAGRMQVKHLVEAGRRRLCLANTFPSCYVKDQLRAGARRAALEAGVEPPVLLNLEFPEHGGSRISPELYAQVKDFLASSRGRIDSFVGIDLTAAVAVRAALSLGVRVPDELAIVGFDDSPTASNCAIPLTTVAQSSEAIGRSMFELLTQRIERPESVRGHQRRMIQPTLVTGASA